MTTDKSTSTGATKTRKKTATTEATQMKETSSYIDTLIKNHQKATSAISETRQRRIRLSNALFDDAMKSQKHALELAKKISEQPAAYKDNVTAIMESLTQAQALSLSKLLVAEQADMRDEFIKTTKAFIDGSQESTKAAISAAKSWSAENPVADILKQSYDSMKMTAAKMTATTA